MTNEFAAKPSHGTLFGAHLPALPRFHTRPSAMRLQQECEHLTTFAADVLAKGNCTPEQHAAWLDALQAWRGTYTSHLVRRR